ncbi:MAG TPA: methyltransferase domain-containing protein [Polyangiaceae bacterium]|nr:methyltransferase domain-containing protein [Polyangiaceae bacterium]
MTDGARETDGPRREPAAFFDAIAGRYERAYALPSAESRRRMERVLRALPTAPARVLDLGVGTGRELTALLDAGHSPTGLDASQAMLERCSRRARPVPVVLADFWRTPLPFDPGAFDAAIALHGTLAHPPEGRSLGKLAHELARIVRKGGVFVAEVPSPAWLERLAAAPPDADRRARRTGPRTGVYEDLVTGASIDVAVFDEAEWRAALAADWRARVESIDELEWLVIADRL